MTTANADTVINASPTKDFFISILVRDIKLTDAIADLLDNSVDGARRLRPNGEYSDLRIDVAFDKNHFTIMDNCGGIPFTIARDYAFRFGRPEGMPETKGSVGQFGVGMKRALFKLGDHFLVESTEPASKFSVDVDVQSWRRSVDNNGRELWEFAFKELSVQPQKAETCGTIITVDKLHPAIAAEFDSPVFESRLIDAIQAAHERSMLNGLVIGVNKHEIQHRLSTLLVSNTIKPLKIDKVYSVLDSSSGNSSEVKATFYAGIAEAKLEEAGWYVVCNGRQILRADKTKTTGWDEVVNDLKIPKAHYQFSRFRGYVFFESDNASALPWNTMKNAVDPDSSVYQASKLEMGAAMRQVIDFLNKLDSEADTESSELAEAIKSTKTQPLSSVASSTSFIYPANTSRGTNPSGRISFNRPNEEIEFAQNYFGVTTNRAAGEKTFEYFLEREKS